MPMYQTRTIASILEPVAQQVSKLIILHEEGEDGNSMPNLEVPVQAVSKAVANLVRVGRDTISSSQDMKMKSEMPKSLSTIEKASNCLEEASSDLNKDPYSQKGRDKLIDGSRGILQGTTAMLISFDASQVSPCLSKVNHDIENRKKDLLNPTHREGLRTHLEQIKTLAPILICSMKIFIQILNQEGKGTEEAVENRTYLAKRMTEEVSQVMRILEDSTQTDNTSKMFNGLGGLSITDMTYHEIMKKVNQLIESNSEISQEMIKHLLDMAKKIANCFEDSQRNQIMQVGLSFSLDKQTNFASLESGMLHLKNRIGIDDIITKRCKIGMVDYKNHIGVDDIITKRGESGMLINTVERSNGRDVPAALQNLEQKINELVINRIITDMADISTPLKQFSDAVLSTEALQRKRDLVDQKGQALKQFSGRLSRTANIVAVANARNKRRSEGLVSLSSQVENLTPQLVNAGTIKINYPENKAADENFENLRKQYAAGVQSIRECCDENIDIKNFLMQTEDHINRSLSACQQGIRNKQCQLIVESTTLAARLSNRLLMALARESENSEDQGLKKEVNQVAEKLKSVIAPFVESSKLMAINVSDQNEYAHWQKCAANLQEMVALVRKLFLDLNMYGLDSGRLHANGNGNGIGIDTVDLAPPPPIPPLPTVEVTAPPRPPLPQGGSAGTSPVPPRPPHPPESEDEDGLFSSEPASNRPIHMAAHGLYQEVKQWDHTDNEIIAAAKKIAYLMAHLSELIRGGKGTKRELIACAKALADASERITELAKELARHCTDKKIRTNLLQVCEKIPTLGTQLRVLSTVKATMMGQTMETEEDLEAMDMLVFNAQKLNQAVKETVRAAEAASIRVRSDAGFKLKWVRKMPWFQ